MRDEGSLNGIYVRITSRAELEPGSTVLVGEQVLRVSLAPTIEDTARLRRHLLLGEHAAPGAPRGAPAPARRHRRLGLSASARPSTIGREGNDINFPDDPFISGRHAELSISASGDHRMLAVTDLGSRNGTFVRVAGERVLRHGDYVFLGQQLLRVEIV